LLPLSGQVNVQSNYWSGTEFDSSDAWGYNYGNGDHGMPGKHANGYGWAVRAGDVSAVPIPPALWLFGSGLLGLIGMAKRENTRTESAQS